MTRYALLNSPRRLALLAIAAALVLAPQWRLGAAATNSRPEDVGLSAERLKRVADPTLASRPQERGWAMETPLKRIAVNWVAATFRDSTP